MDTVSSSAESEGVRSYLNLEVQENTTTLEDTVQRKGLSTLSGCIYQLKLLMLLLKRGVDLNYSFRLCTEIETAKKFDDLVLEITNEDNQKVYRLFQAKHKEDESKKIRFRNLLTEINGPYNLIKYFHSYQDAKEEELFKDGKIKDVTICTNINFNFESNLKRLKILKKFDSNITIRDTVKKIVHSDSILDMENETLTKESVRYRFNKNIIEPLKSVLFEYDLPKLAERLARCLLKKKPIDHCKDTFLKLYHGILAKEVIDANNKKFFDEFIDGSSVSIETSTFRKMFKQEINKKSQKTDFNKINDYILENKFALNLLTGFGEGGGNSWSPSKHIKKFLKRLVFAVNLPNENELGEILQNNIGREFNFVATEHVYNDVFMKMLDWLKSKGEGFISHEDGKRLFDDSKKTLYGFGLNGFTWECQSIIEKYNIIFKPEDTVALQLHEFLSHKMPSKQIFRIITEQNKFSAVKVCGILASIPEYKKDFSYIFMNIDNVLNLQDYVVQTFKEGSINLCVISCNLYKKHTKKLYSHLSKVILNNIDKKLVLITHKKNLLVSYFKHDKCFKNKYVEKPDNCNAFIDLTSVSQKNILERKKVIFQGKEISLGTLIDEESKDLIREDALFKLISDEKMKIGNPPFTLGDEENYYIQRKFNRSVEIYKKFTSFSSYAVEQNLNNDNTYLIKYNGEDIHLYEGLDIVLISDSESDFNTLCDKDKENKLNIHWLMKEDNVFVWQRTHGSLSKLRKFVNYERKIIYKPHNVGDIKDKIVIIAADSGMGKSTVLTVLALQSKYSDPDLWIERIDLHKHTKSLNEVQFENTHTAITFILDILKLKTSFERDLFTYRVHKQGNIALLFDGFDEISPDYKEKVFNLLKILSENTRVKHLWITTRPHIKNEIEEQFSMFSYDLQPLSKKEQKIFLKNYLSKELDSRPVNKNRLVPYTEGLLRLLSESTVTVDNKKEFCGIPLHLRLLAEVFVEDFKAYHDSNEDKLNLPEELGLVGLYKLFIKKKFDIYWEEKTERDMTNPSIKNEYRKLYGPFILEHKIVALTTLFSHYNELDILSAEDKETDKKFREDISKEEERIGIVSIIDGTTCFTHRSFAEYFIVEFFSDKLKSVSFAENIWSFLLNKILITDCQNIRKFFDNKLEKDHELANLSSKSEIKESVITLLQQDSSISCFCKVAEENLVNILNFLLKFVTGNSYMFNRITNSDILSNVVSEGHKVIAEILLRYVKDTDEKSLLKMINVGDNLYSIPLQVAIRKDDQKMIDILLNYVEDTDQLENILNFCSSSKYTALYYAVDDYYMADGNHILFKYIEKLNPDQRYNVIYHTCKGMTTDDYGVPLGSEMSPMYRAEELADFSPSDDRQCINLLSLVNDKSSLIDYILKMIKEDRYPTKCIRENLTSATPKSINTKFLDEKVKVFKPLLQIACEAALKYRPAYIDLIKCFVEKGADVNAHDIQGTTPLHLATGDKNGFEVVKYLVKEGADINRSDRKGATPLHLAAGAENGLKIVEYLVTEGADFKLVDGDGRTPLHYAAQHGKSEVVEYLIGKEDDFICIDKYGKTPLNLAEEKGHQQVINFLNQKCFKRDLDSLGLQTSHKKYDFKQLNLPIKRRYDET